MKKRSRINKFRGKRVGLSILKVIEVILKNVYYLMVGIVYLIVKGYLMTERAFLKGFKKFPVWLKRTILLTILLNVFILSNKGAEVVEKIVTNIEVEEVYIIKEVVKEEAKCVLGEYECVIYDEAIEQGLSKKEAMIAIAISKHETGNYTSKIFLNKNNIGGLYNGSTKSFYSYNSVDEGVEAYIQNLKKGYFDKGLNTIEKIQKKYAPINADNDPTGLNNEWVSGVTYFYNELV